MTMATRKLCQIIRLNHICSAYWNSLKVVLRILYCCEDKDVSFSMHFAKAFQVGGVDRCRKLRIDEDCEIVSSLPLCILAYEQK